MFCLCALVSKQVEWGIDLQEAMVTEIIWNKRSFNWMYGKTFSMWEESNSGRGCPHRLCSLHTCRFSRSHTEQLSNLVSSYSWPSKSLEYRPQLKFGNNISPSYCSISGQCRWKAIKCHVIQWSGLRRFHLHWMTLSYFIKEIIWSKNGKHRFSSCQVSVLGFRTNMKLWSQSLWLYWLYYLKRIGKPRARACYIGYLIVECLEYTWYILV